MTVVANQVPLTTAPSAVVNVLASKVQDQPGTADADVNFAQVFNVARFGSFAAAVTAAAAYGKGTVHVGPGTWPCPANVTVPSTVGTKFDLNGAMIQPATGVTVTINGPLDAPPSKIFDLVGTGVVVLGSGAVRETLSEWWGAKPDGATDSYGGILAARNAINSAGGGILRLLDGTYYSPTARLINISSNFVVRGNGRGKTVTSGFEWYIAGAQNSEISDMTMTAPSVVLNNSAIMVVSGCSNVAIRRVDFKNLKTVAGLLIYANANTESGITVEDCIATDLDNMGFFIGGESSPSIVQNVIFSRCRAIRCGKAATRASDFITGFDLGEYSGMTVKNITCEECYAEENWESGFHIENSPTKSNVNFINCTSINNGINKTTPTYGSGFLFSAGCALRGCYTSGNKLYGYFASKQAVVGFLRIENCKSYSDVFGSIFVSGGGATDTDEMFIDGFYSLNSQKWGARMFATKNIHAKRFFLVGMPGDSGATLCNFFGSNASPLDSCEFELYVSGGATQYVVYCQGGSNIDFSGFIRTTQISPIGISGGTNISIHDMHIINHGSSNRGIDGLGTAKTNCTIERTVIEDTDPSPNLATGVFNGAFFLNLATCRFPGVTTPYDSTVLAGFRVTTPAVPATTVNQKNTNPFPVRVHIVTAGTTTDYTITDPSGATQLVTVALTAGKDIVLDAGASLKITYSVAPTWKWYGT